MGKLKIVQLGNQTLRKMARELTVEEILSAPTQQLIEEMKQTMRKALGVGLAAPQIGETIQLAVIEDGDLSHLTEEQLLEKDRHLVPFHVIINPRIYPEGSETIDHFEGCLSLPHFLAVVPRFKTVRVECLNEKAEPIVIHATGWYARILQHEIDHLYGMLYIDRAHLRTLMTEENYLQQWKGKTIHQILESVNNNC